MLNLTSSRDCRSGALVLGLSSVLAFSSAWAGHTPNADVKRQLFPAQSALAQDSLLVADREATKALALDPEVTDTHLILAEAAWRRGDLKKAKAAYQKAKDLGGADGEAQAGLALVALGEDDLAGAETLANLAVASDKGSWLANYALGSVLVTKGQHEAAFKQFEKGKGLKGRADRRDLFEAGMGRVALAENDADGAATSFIKARALAPNTIEHTMNLAAMYEATNQWSQAAIVLQQAEQKTGSSPLLTFRMGRAAEKQKNYNDALKLYQKVLASDSTFTPALAAVGHLYLLDTRRSAQAAEVLSRAVQQKPTYQSRLDLGTALTRTAKPLEAIPLLEAALQENASIEAKVALARAYAAGDMLDKSLPLYQDVDVQTEAPAADLVGVARALVKAKRADEAKVFLDQAAERDPANSDVYYVRGLIEMGAKNMPGALQAFDKKLEMDPKHVLSVMNKANILLGMGKKQEALAAYRQATVLAPNSVPVWVAFGTALSADSTAAASKAFDRALALDPKSVEAMRGKGLIFLLLEKYTDAIQLLTAATAAEPDDVDGWVWLGQALLNSGKHSDAREALQRALKLDPNNKDAKDGLQLLSSAVGSH